MYITIELDSRLECALAGEMIIDHATWLHNLVERYADGEVAAFDDFEHKCKVTCECCCENTANRFFCDDCMPPTNAESTHIREENMRLKRDRDAVSEVQNEERLVKAVNLLLESGHVQVDQDGDSFRAMLPERFVNLQESDAGFGDTPMAAVFALLDGIENVTKATP